MKAFLLSAGLGTRLRPLTDEIPKCLLPIGGKPLLQIWMELMGRHGVSEVLVNTHWHAEKVESFVNSYSLLVNGLTQRRPSTICGSYGAGKDAKAYEERITNQQITNNFLKVRVFHEAELLGSAGTLWANRGWIEDGEAFFILYGDNLTNVDLGKMWRFHKGHGLPFTLGVFKAERPETCGIAEVDGDGMVTGFVEKPDEPKSDLAAAGVYVADSRIFDFYPEDTEVRKPLDLGFDVIPNLVGKMKAYVIDEFLTDIGTADSYEKAKKEADKLLS